MNKPIHHRLYSTGLTALIAVVLFVSVAPAQIIPLLGGQRSGISSLQFLKIGTGARAIGMAEAFVAVADDATALHYNPAGMVQFDGHRLHFSHTEWLVDLRHEFAGVVYRISSADALGLSFTSLHTADMERTTETQPYGTGTYFTYGDLAVGLSYSRSLTSQFSFGATVRYVEETIDILKTRALLIDLGTFYWTGLGSTRFAVTVSNFGQNVSPEGTITHPQGFTIDSYQDFSPPTLFKIGFAFEPYMDEMQRITASVQLNHPNDNSENLALGAEYAWNDLFYVRAGYKVNVDEESFAVGAGLNAPLGFSDVGVDYAFAEFGRLGGVHRISVKMKIGSE